jgi:hypothetical protein
MPVTLKLSGRVIRRNRREGYNKKVRQLAAIFIQLQAKGYISAGHLADALRTTDVCTSKGKPYAESTIFNMLKRAQELGFPVVRRSRSGAQPSVRGSRAPRSAAKPNLRGSTS